MTSRVVTLVREVCAILVLPMCALMFVASTSVAQGGLVALPCTLDELLPTGNYIEAGGVRYGEFAVDQSLSNVDPAAVKIVDVSAPGASGLQLVPDDGSMRAQGEAADWELNLFYSASAMLSDAKVTGGTLSIAGSVSPESGVSAFTGYDDAELNLPIPDHVGGSFVYDSTFGGTNNADVSHFTHDVRSVSAAVGLSSFTVDENGTANLSSATVTLAITVPEPHGLALTIQGLSWVAGAWACVWLVKRRMESSHPTS